MSDRRHSVAGASDSKASETFQRLGADMRSNSSLRSTLITSKSEASDSVQSRQIGRAEAAQSNHTGPTSIFLDLEAS
jgi:hypothetical protein